FKARARDDRTWRLGQTAYSSKQTHIRSLEIGHHTCRYHRFSQSCKRQMSDHHCWNGHMQWIWSVERRAAGVMKKHGLKTELNGRNQGCSVDGNITGNCCREYSLARI